MTKPLLVEVAGAAGRAGSEPAGRGGYARPQVLVEGLENQPPRQLAVYSASAGFELVEELDFLAARAVEPNVFFNPRFLAPAMPRLEDRDVRLAVIRDGNEFRSRLRLLVPFSIERPSLPFAVPHLRVWSSSFGPLGTPLLDSDDPVGVMGDCVEMMSRPHLNLPKVLVMPEVRLDGPFAAMLGLVAEHRGLPLEIIHKMERAHLQTNLAGDDYLRASLNSHHLGEFRRLKRRLGDKGTLEYKIARQTDEVRLGIENFLILEAAGWKGRARTAMAVDRYRAAFVREAAHRLAENDMCRVHSLLLDGKTIASLVVFVERGVAYTWKTAYDEAYAAYSPGMLLMIETTKTHLDDPNIDVTDSCAVPDHPMMNRLWSERRPLGTFILGLSPEAGRQTRQAALYLERQRNTRAMARNFLGRLKKAIKRS